METFDNLTINLVEDNLALLNFLMAFLMFGVALDIKLGDLLAVLKSPKKVLIGLSSQVILLPILTLILLWIWQPMVSLGMGLLLIASVPGGNLSNFTVHLAHGNTALSILMTSVITVAAVVITPLVFLSASTIWIQSGVADVPQESLRVPFGKIVEIVTVLLIIPMTLGMFLAHRFPVFVQKIKKAVRWISLFIFLAFIVGALLENHENIRRYMKYIFWLVILHNLLALFFGYQYARRLWGMSKADSRAVSIETGIQNGGLAIILILNFFPDLGGMLLIVAWWGVWDMISALLLGLYWSKFPVGISE